MVSKKCKNCGKKVKEKCVNRFYRSGIKKGQQSTSPYMTLPDYCSDDCRTKYHQKNNKRITFSRADKQEIFDRDGRVCRYCGYEATTIDHIIPVTKGGTNDYSNLVACCRICNSIANNKLFKSFEDKKKWLLSQQGIKEYKKASEKEQPKWHKWVYGSGRNPKL